MRHSADRYSSNGDNGSPSAPPAFTPAPAPPAFAPAPPPPPHAAATIVTSHDYHYHENPFGSTSGHEQHVTPLPSPQRAPAPVQGRARGSGGSNGSSASGGGGGGGGGGAIQYNNVPLEGGGTPVARGSGGGGGQMARGSGSVRPDR
jgi:hypothetical protein